MVKALDLRSNGRIVRVGSNPTPGIIFTFISLKTLRGSVATKYKYCFATSVIRRHFDNPKSSIYCLACAICERAITNPGTKKS